MRDPFPFLSLALLLLSTPLSCYYVYVQGELREDFAVANAYTVALGMLGLYLAPLLTVFERVSFKKRLHAATLNWAAISTSLALLVQLPHILGARFLDSVRGSMWEWPFFVYGTCDSRWSDYRDGYGLVPTVSLINLNSVMFALALIVAYWYKTSKGYATFRSSVPFILVLVFRDATLFRQTLEYLWLHHRLEYPFTTSEVLYRVDSIIALWGLNLLSLVAPVFTLLWAYQRISTLIVRERRSLIAQFKKKSA
eukprot:TRINITY_DN3600_c0_g1_i1.p1 TRINITY_DN3600_c0_g1~~TRINITY_DN3600_c0_g1_i1.p1  ORF type:complete len:260 (-),score=36.10 TRINITY_DN3600_c0_g1_i1:175-933(-)